MDTTSALNLAYSLMKQHGLTDAGWHFSFDRAKRRAGACHYSKRTITMSSTYVSLNTEDSIRNTMLHEIAHALAGFRAAHGAEWVRVAKSIGCDGKRCTSEAITDVKARYEAYCPTGLHLAAQYHRRPGDRMLRGGYCRKHGNVLTWIDTSTNERIISASTIFTQQSTTTVKTAASTKKRVTTTTVTAKPWVSGSSDWDALWD